MDSSSSQKSANLFQVYLRLRPPPAGAAQSDRFLDVEECDEDSHPTHITMNPPNDRKRSTEKFAFTRVFEEDATQLDVFHCIGVASLVEGVLAPHGGQGTDALIATLGVTGSGKSHTILGSRSTRGMTQLALDVVFRSIGTNLYDSPDLEGSLQASDFSDAIIISAPYFLETVFADFGSSRGGGSRAGTPMLVGDPVSLLRTPFLRLGRHEKPHLPPSMSVFGDVRLVPPTPDSPRRKQRDALSTLMLEEHLEHQGDAQRQFMTMTVASKTKDVAKTSTKGEHYPPPTPRRNLQRPSALPCSPDISSVNVSSDPDCDYAVVLSMYEVYNDKIYDLLTPPIKSNATKEYRRRPLLFKSTEYSADRKVVAGLKKIVCTNMREAIMVLEAGLHERQVAGTGSNSVSSRSHGFFCVEVKKRAKVGRGRAWVGNTLTVVDLAGSERARDAKTQGATLAEAGKINESLMYLGQCLQAQSGMGSSNKPTVMPFRQCKMTELLFSNSFSATSSAGVVPRRNAQRAVMIVTADAQGDVNATSQILRYSALAREVTIPRIPSITSTLLADTPTTSHPSAGIRSPDLPQHRRGYFGHGSAGHRSFSPGSDNEDRVLMEHAALEIARMQEEITNLHIELDNEREARISAEAHLLSMEDRLLDVEQTVREDCMAEFDARFEMELARWKATLAAEQEKGEEHWDRKMELFEKGLGVTLAEDDNAGDDKENLLIEDLEDENERLRRENEVLKRELAARSPTKRKPLQERADFSGRKAGTGVSNLGQKMEQLRVSNESTAGTSNSGSPKKMRKLATKRCETVNDHDF
ncbi:kinesin motor domain-containing protein [Colletotrichum graminicola]|uniref:Kinesin motor domain-containing protein n=1 Tax=Colletotrichum graminicola (strain M1.001 / M2 / FGSC 10212) TaxID=645133 RepID=E3R080_COLGM|nr:kinesin motor domain-containing protein [Colletotrichum graminicola M1.001]EFQ36518.1 kinesin motor domain-containing protein [Colletotrichum graminicola M1.001]WDK14829.1 kinesin motor domain-containing protein [Colletotrichum graminicola]